ERIIDGVILRYWRKILPDSKFLFIQRCNCIILVNVAGRYVPTLDTAALFEHILLPSLTKPIIIYLTRKFNYSFLLYDLPHSIFRRRLVGVIGIFLPAFNNPF